MSVVVAFRLDHLERQHQFPALCGQDQSRLELVRLGAGDGAFKAVVVAGDRRECKRLRPFRSIDNHGCAEIVGMAVNREAHTLAGRRVDYLQRSGGEIAGHLEWIGRMMCMPASGYGPVSPSRRMFASDSAGRWTNSSPLRASVTATTSFAVAVSATLMARSACRRWPIQRACTL